eukprot:m.103348 g.103348  ORF g.103348 m.103348 type:complete len:323 (-) comp51568_c0_seq1:166-1134(-)
MELKLTREVYREAMATGAYSLASMLMIYSNKWILAVFQFQQAGILLIIQGLLAVIILKLLAVKFAFIDLQPLQRDRIVLWMPVTVLFAVMLFSGSKTLAYLSIPIVTVFKNMTNLLIAYGDWAWFGQTISRGVIISFLMMIIGSILSGFTDLEFNIYGYLWMAVNCFSQAGYALYMKRASKATMLSEWGSAYYNNFLSVPVLAVVCFLNNEFATVTQFPLLTDNWFLGAVAFSGVIGTGLSLSVFWLVNVTSPTTYSMIGALNKIPITIISVFVFSTVLTPQSIFSIGVGLASGIVYTYTKYLETVKRQQESLAALQKVESK